MSCGLLRRVRVLVTGANGFLGRHVVAALARRGHAVSALVRPHSPTDALPRVADVEVVRAELLTSGELAAALAEIDVVVHLAAALTGTREEQFAVTVLGTERLLEAMSRAGCTRLVLASSLAVYDWSAARDELDERTPLVEVHGPHGRDVYAIVKSVQDRLARRTAEERGWQLAVLRPGFIWGRDHAHVAGVGPRLGPLHVVVGPWGQIPITYVENCADAFALACERPAAAGRALNVVDDARVTAWRYLGDFLARSRQPGLRIPIPYAAAWHAVRALSAVARRVPGVRARLPGVLVPGQFEARFKRLRFPNDAARAILGWEPRWSYAECLDRTYGSGLRPQSA